MALLRILGLLVAVGLLISAGRRYRRGALRIPDAVITSVVAVILITLAAVPSSVDPLLRELGFPPGDARRVIGVLVMSNLLLYFLLLRAFAKTDRLESKLRDYAHRIATRAFLARYKGDPAPSRAGKLCIVIPALNEEASLGEVLSAVPPHINGLETEVIVVSDGSTDSTETVAAANGALVVPSDLRAGQGAAVSLGYRLALARGAEVVATLDADGQYVPAELPRLIAPILKGEADVVHGSRTLGRYESPIRGRAVGVTALSKATSLITRVQITDPASGFRAFTPEALLKLHFREPQFHAGEVTIAAVKAGLRVVEVPCTFRERRAGVTKKPPFFKYGYGYARSLLRTWLG